MREPTNSNSHDMAPEPEGSEMDALQKAIKRKLD
jgi:hypothetical protein